MLYYKMKKMGPKCKYINGTKLSKPQKKKLMLHSDHHTLKHIKSMIVNINKGKTFTQSHKIAQMSVGK